MNQKITAKNTDTRSNPDGSVSLVYHGVPVATRHLDGRLFVRLPGYLENALATRLCQVFKVWGLKARACIVGRSLRLYPNDQPLKEYCSLILDEGITVQKSIAGAIL